MTYISADSALTVCREMYKNDASIEDIILVLRIFGFPQSISSILLSKALSISSADAKKAVIDSIVWSDSFDANTVLQKAISKYTKNVPY